MPDHAVQASSDYILWTEDRNTPCLRRHAKLIGFTLLLMSLAGIKRSGFDFPCPFGRKMRRESHGNGPVVSRPGLRDHQGSLAGSKYRNITPRTMDVETAMLYGRVYNLEFHSWPYPTPSPNVLTGCKNPVQNCRSMAQGPSEFWDTCNDEAHSAHTPRELVWSCV